MFAAVLAIALAGPIWMPKFRLAYFSPFLVVLCYQYNLSKCIWGAFFCGLFVDLLSAQSTFGIFAVNYILSMLVVYKQRLNFFGDRQSTLPIMTFIFSVSSGLFHCIFLIILDVGVLVSLKTIFNDLAFFPLCNAAYAYAIFVLPWALLGPAPKRGSDYFKS